MSAVKEASIQRDKISRQDDMFASKVGFFKVIRLFLGFDIFYIIFDIYYI